MGGFLQVTLLFSLCIALCLGIDYPLQPPSLFPNWKLINPVRVIPNVPGVTLKRVGVATTTCSTYLVTLDDSPTDCLKFYDQDAKFKYSNCNRDLLDSHDMYFFASGGYVFTLDGRFVIVDMYTGGIIDTVGVNETGAAMPWMSGVFSSFGVPTNGHAFTLIDKDVNSTAFASNWQSDNGNAPFTAVNTYSKTVIGSLGNTEPIICMFVTSSFFHIVTQGANHTQAWQTRAPATINRRVTGFGEIGACGVDFFSRLWIWDKSDSKLKVVSETGIVFFEQELPEVVNPIRIFPTRNKIYIQDQNGVLRYDLPKLSIFTRLPNVTCATSTVAVTLNGGSAPYVARLVPDFSAPFTFQLATNSLNASGTLDATYIDLYDRSFTIYDDVFALEYTELRLPNNGISVTNSTLVPPHSGTNVWSMFMTSGAQYGVIANPELPGASISATDFSAIEMWIYVNPTVGKFQIDIPPLSFVYNTGDIPPETWRKITFDLTTTATTSSAPIPLFNRILFTDLSLNATNNPFIFVDAIRAIPYPSTDRKITIYDFCGVYNETAYEPFADRSSVFRAEVASPSVSCNAAGASGTKAADAVFVANVTGGVRPYTYTWTIPSAPANNVNTVRNLGATDNYLSLYDNSVGADFIDYSNTPVSYSDSTYFKSPPYSLSFEPSGSVLNDLVYFIAGGISTSKYKFVEFYINGGDVGGQIIRIGLLSSQLTLATETFTHRVAPAQPSIRAGYWTKITYPIPSSTSTYYGFVFSGIVGKLQPRVYIDDVKFIATTQRLQVKDALNCTVTTNLFVLQPRVVAATSIVNNVKCYESTDGIITLNVNGGSGTYNYNWLNSTNHKKDYTLSGLSQGTFAVQVSDTNNCTTVPLVTRVSVLRPPAITLTHNTEHSKCAGSSGTIVAKVHGGVPPYYYRWTSPTRSFFDALAVEAPYAMFSDSLQNGFVLSPNTFTSILCLGNTDLSSHTGYCSLSVVPPVDNTGMVLFGIGCPNCFDFSLYTAVKLWIRVTRDTDIPKLRAGLIRGNETVYSQPLFNYTTTSTEWQEVIITFPNDFDSADYFRIANSGSSVVDFLIDSMSLIPIGTFSKGLNVASGFIAVVEALGGDFTLSVRDSNGCPVDYNFTVNEPPPLSVTFSFQAPNDTSGSLGGRVYAQASGGVGGYTYFWPELNQYSQTADNLEAGTYSIVVTDANGCVLNSSALLPFSIRSIRKYSPGVATGFGVILALGVILTFASLAILATKWSHFAHYGPFYCVIINVGVLVSYISVAVVIPEPTDALCILFPWFLGIGFTLVYGCLFIKTWVLYRVFRKASQMKKTNLTPFYILKVLSFFMAIEVIFMIVWTVVDPPKAAYADLVDNEREMQCTNKSDTFWIIFLAYKGAWIIFGAILAFLTRNISEEYNESKSIAYAIYNDIVLIVIGIILALTLAQVPSGVVIVEAAIVFLSFTFTMLILFFPIWWKIFFSSVDLTDMKLPSRSGGGSSGGSGGNSGGPASANSKASFSVNTANSQNTHSSRMDVYTL